jgi:hypothetical protein
MTGYVDFEEFVVARRDALLRTGVATPAPPMPTVEASTTPSFVDLTTGTTTPIGGSLEGGFG